MIRIASLPPTGNGPPADAVDPVDRDRIATYLDTGTPILTSTATTADRYAPDAGTPVPLTVRSDGTWVWSDAIPYYWRAHGLPPHPDLVAHIREREYRCPELTETEAAHVLTAFIDLRSVG